MGKREGSGVVLILMNIAMAFFSTRDIEGCWLGAVA